VTDVPLLDVDRLRKGTQDRQGSCGELIKRRSGIRFDAPEWWRYCPSARAIIVKEVGREIFPSQIGVLQVRDGTSCVARTAVS